MMSVAHGMRVLDLQSQIDVLERLRLLTNFGSSLLMVTGDVGAGKTWLAQRFLEAWAEDKNQSLLMCFPNQDDEQRRLTVLSQIDSRAFFDPSLSLLENISDLVQQDPCNIVIVVDDAQLLSQTLLSELWMLVLDAQRRPNWSISVILFSLPGMLESIFSKLGYGQEQKPIEVEIEPLTQQDADRFFECYVLRYIEESMERRVQHAYLKTKKLPGEIMALGEQKMEKRIIIRSIVASPKIIAAIIVILMLAIGGGYYGAFFLDGGNSAGRHQQVVHDLDIVQPDAMVTNAQNAHPSEPTDESSTEATLDDSNTLPPEVVKKFVSVGVDEPQRKRVVISSAVVDALIQDEPEDDLNSEGGDQMQNVITKTETTPTQSRGQQSVQPVPVSTQALTAHSEFKRSIDALMAMSDRYYTIQLGAFRSLTEVRTFLQQHHMQDKIHVYTTQRQNVDWFIVTYDSFPTIQLTRDAIERLPTSLKMLGPWAKSLQQVHREIERAK